MKDNLRGLYRIFLHEHANKKFLSKYENITVLGENFIGGFYVVVFETGNPKFPGRFILILNTQEEILNKIITVPHPNGYVIFPQKEFMEGLPPKLQGALIKRGLFKSLKTAKNGKNSLTSLHRLVACLYGDILGQEIHHIYTKRENGINSIMPLEADTNRKLEQVPKEEAIAQSLQLQKPWKEKISRKRRKTLANNTALITEILKASRELSKKDIVKKFSKKLGKSAIYEALSFYFHRDEFLKWLEDKENEGFSGLDGKLAENL